MSYTSRSHAFAYGGRPDVYDLPPWAPAGFPQTLPTDVADVASSLWIEVDTYPNAYVEDEPEPSACSSRIPWLDSIAPAFDVSLLASLDAQLLFRPEQAFADVCWAAAVNDADVDAELPPPQVPAPLPAAHPPLAEVATPTEATFTSYEAYEDEDESEDDDADSGDGDATPIVPPYIPTTTIRAVDEHNRLLGAPFADTLNFTPLRRRDINSAKGDPNHIEPYPLYKPDFDAAAALLLLQPQPLAHWHVSGSVAAASDSVGGFPIQRPAKSPGRFFAYFNARARPHSPV